MDYQEVISTIKGKSGVYDIITLHVKERRRLYLSQNNLICEFAAVQESVAILLMVISWLVGLAYFPL